MANQKHNDSTSSPEALTQPKPGPNRWLIGGVGMSVVLFAIMALTFRQSAFPPKTIPEIAGVQSFSDLERSHRETTVYYPSLPPVGGAHSKHWYNAGIYDYQIPMNQVVHTLEHGAVWLTYDPSLSAYEVETLRKLARGQPCVVVSPFQRGKLPSKIAAVAWGRLLELNSADDPRIRKFIFRFQRGSQTPEFGEFCKGDEGRPIE